MVGLADQLQEPFLEPGLDVREADAVLQQVGGAGDLEDDAQGHADGELGKGWGGVRKECSRLKKNLLSAICKNDYLCCFRRSDVVNRIHRCKFT